MIDPSTWTWPQYTILLLMFISLAIHAVQHGKPQPTGYSFPIKLCNAILWLFLLTFGGFFA